MFAVEFDDLARKLDRLEKPVYLNKLLTTQSGTPDFDVYMGLYMMPDNDSIHIKIESDNRTYTFYTIIADQHLIDLAKKRKAEKFDDAERARRNPTGSFV